MNFSTIFFYILLITINPLFSTNYKLSHSKQTPWPGFFSVFNMVLGALDFYDNSSDMTKGLTVDFKTTGFFYDSTLGENWWDYYFEPIKFVAHDTQEIEFKEYKKIIFSFLAQMKLSRARSHELITKYIKIKPHIQKKVDSFIQENFKGNTVIGIHYRGTDKKIEAHLVNFETIARLLHDEIEHNKTIKIFVATDDENFLNFMYRTFPGKIVARNSIRSKNETPVHSDPTHNPYQKGEDALLDCLLLSGCSKLYKTASNLSDVAIKFNPHIPVINLSRHFTEQTNYTTYNFCKVISSIVMLLDNYEKNTQAGFTVHLPSGINNWWEYHFEPLVVGENHPKLELTDADLTILSFNCIYEMNAKRAYELISKYVCIKPHITAKIDAFFKNWSENSFIITVFYLKEDANNYQKYNELILQTDKALKNSPHKNKILLISNDELFIHLMGKEFSNIITPSNHMGKTADGEMDLLLCLMMARTQYIIGSQSVYLKLVSQFNPSVPVIELGEHWLEK